MNVFSDHSSIPLQCSIPVKAHGTLSMCILQENVLKLADFGSCKSVYSKQPYTEYISTRWYRAPECLLTDGYYTHKMDMWSVGCVMFEVMTLRPLFPGANELDQVHKIHDIVGSPSTNLLNKFKK
jgi:renal tumor antigen